MGEKKNYLYTELQVVRVENVQSPLEESSLLLDAYASIAGDGGCGADGGTDGGPPFC